LNVYRKYVKYNKCPTICIDATGSLVKKPYLLLSNRNTKHILLYEIAIHDKQLASQYSVSHMLSEKHDNNSIRHWLEEWIRDGAPKPKQVVTDMSLALMAAVVKAFTQFNTIFSYIEGCFNCLCKNDINLPQCFVRNDVAHVIKLVTNWSTFRSVDIRIKDFIVRTIGQIILCEDFYDVQNILKHLFWLIYSKTDGTLSSGQNTYAAQGIDFLRKRIATGTIDQYSTVSSAEVNYTDDDDSENELTLNENTNHNENCISDHKKGPFYEAVKEIALKCKEQVEFEMGNHDNLYYLPNIIPDILNLCTYLPLWSGIMCKTFKYGDNPPSSAAIESQFNDLKNRVLKHVNCMPMRVDDFLKTHIESLNGTMKLVNSKMISQESKNDQMNTNEKSPIIYRKSPDHSIISNSDRSPTYNKLTLNDQPYQSDIHEKHYEFKKVTEDIWCVTTNSDELIGNNLEIATNNDNEQTEGDGSSMSVASSKDMEDDTVDQYQFENEKMKNVTQNIHSVPNLEDEKMSEENWRNIQGGSRKRKSIYLTPNPEILLRNMDSRAKTKVIGLIKNGSISRFMSVKFNNKNYVLSNTCSFDTIVQMLAVAYCDSSTYTKYVMEKKEENTLWELIFCLLRDGVTVQTYKKRVAILSNLCSGELILNGIDSMLNMLLKNYESVVIEENCNSCKFKRLDKKPFLTICVKEKMPTKRQLNLLINDEINQLYNSAINCQVCNDIIEVNVVLGEHVFFNLINLNNTTDALFTDTRILLNHIPKSISTPQSQYYLRGLGTTPDNQQSTTSYETIGHYHAHTFRNPINSWQIYDDTKEKVHSVNENTKVNLQIILYSM